MVYSDFNTPSDNMNLPQRQIASMIREQQEAMYKEEEDKIFAEQSRLAREAEENANYVQEYIENQTATLNRRAEFLESVKNAFLIESMCKLYKDSFDEPLNKRDQIVVRNLIKNFVTEQGSGDLLNRFKYQNVLVAEMGKMVQNYYNKVVDSINEETAAEEEIKKHDNDSIYPGRSKDLHLDQIIVDDFYKDLVDLDTTEASKLIKDKVADAMSDFVDQNMQNRLDYEEVINTAKEKMADMKEESAIEETMNEAKRQINEMKLKRHKNVFHYLVEAISKQAFKDQNIGKQYIHESQVDMDGVVHSAKLIYTMLEMINTTEMVDSNYIKSYVESLVEA